MFLFKMFFWLKWMSPDVGAWAVIQHDITAYEHGQLVCYIRISVVFLVFRGCSFRIHLKTDFWFHATVIDNAKWKLRDNCFDKNIYLTFRWKRLAENAYWNVVQSRWETPVVAGLLPDICGCYVSRNTSVVWFGEDVEICLSSFGVCATEAV